MLNCKFLIIGSGETGLYLSKELALIGHPTILIEQDSFGGSYISTNEIPKYWLKAESKKFHSALEILKSHPSTHKPLLKQRQSLSKDIQEKISSTYNYFLQDYQTTPNLQVLNASASFFSKNLIEITANGEKDFVSFEQLILCVGRNIIEKPKLLASTSSRYLYQHNVFLLNQMPEKLLILEINPDSLEVANIYANLGFPVTIIEPNSLENCMAYLDIEAKEYMIEILSRKKVEFLFNIFPEEVKENTSEIIVKHSAGIISGSHLYFKTKEKFQDLGLNLSKIGVSQNINGIQTDIHSRTNIENIWAMGECNSNWNIFDKYNRINNFLFKLKNNRQQTQINLSSALNDNSGTSNTTFFQCHFDIDNGISQLGLTEKKARAIYSPDVTVEFVQKTELEGFAKIIYRPSGGQILGACLTGEIGQQYASLTRNYMRKHQSGIELIKNMYSH